MAVGWYGFAAIASRVHFEDLPEPAAPRFLHQNGATGEYYLPEIMGAGVALFDYDNDGDLDVFAVQGGPLGIESPGAAHRLYRNEWQESGQLRFSDAGTGPAFYGMGVAAADYDSDGFTDLYVTGCGRAALLHNDGHGGFEDRAPQAGVASPLWSASAAWVDYDHDGDLDLYVTNYVDFSVRSNKKCYAPTGERDYCSPSVYNAQTDRLYRNEGAGKFTDVTLPSGIASASGPGLGVVCFDFDRDDWTDIYVANDGGPNFLWRNKGNGTFEEVALNMGVAFNTDGNAQAGMGVDAADLRRTGRDDLIVTNMRHETWNLYVQDATGFYTDLTTTTGLARSSYSHTGFGVRFADFDADGWLDLFAANGSVARNPGLRGDNQPYRETNQLILSQPGGTRLADRSAVAGSVFHRSEVSRGVATGDLDNDGDIDVVISTNGGPLRLLVNYSDNKRAWVGFQLQSRSAGNRNGIGARVVLYRSGEQPQSRRAQTDGSYLSSGDPRVHFGIGARPEFDRVEVVWPSGKKEGWKGLASGRYHVLREGAGEP